MHRTQGLLSLSLALALVGAAPQAQSAEDLYNRAYVLENEGGDYAEAARLYERALQSRGASEELRGKVEERLAICAEEIACEDFAGLMPENPLLYVELNRPGDQLESLLDELGLLQMARSAAGDEGSEYGISPALVQGLLGMRGAAIAVTGVNPQSGDPTGVAVLHPGDLELVRGLIETALPNGAQSVGSVEGHPTYSIDDGGFVTLTARLVVASTHKREIKRVIERLHGDEDSSLADNGLLARAMGDRTSSLLTFCANPAPLVPLARMAAAQDPEAAAWMSLCDPASFETVVGRLRVQDGLSLDLTLNMADGHENLAYHFLRMPPIQAATLDRVPAGAAAFLAASLNPARTYSTDHGGEPYVSFMDVGRELFGNVASFALFVLPPSGETNPMGWPMPDVGAVVTVNDPAKTRGLWNLLLGVASMSSGAGEFGGESLQVAGTTVQRFSMPEGMSVFGAVEGQELFLGTSSGVLEAALGTRRGGASVRSDRELASALARFDENSTLAAVVHAGRCLDLGTQFAGDYQAEEMAMVAEHIEDTSAAVVFSHGADALRFSVGVSSLPNVGELLSAQMAEEHAIQEGGESDDYDVRHDEVVYITPPQQGGSVESLVAEFDRLAQGGYVAEAVAQFEHVYPHVADDALWLNNFAWALLTESRYDGKFHKLAHKLSLRSNELSSYGNWAYVDTLALALFETGDVKRAIEHGRKALTLVGHSSQRADVEAALARFEASDQAPDGGDV